MCYRILEFKVFDLKVHSIRNWIKQIVSLSKTFEVVVKIRNTLPLILAFFFFVWVFFWLYLLICFLYFSFLKVFDRYIFSAFGIEYFFTEDYLNANYWLLFCEKRSSIFRSYLSVKILKLKKKCFLNQIHLQNINATSLPCIVAKYILVFCYFCSISQYLSTKRYVCFLHLALNIYILF